MILQFFKKKYSFNFLKMQMLFRYLILKVMVAKLRSLMIIYL